MEGYAKCTTDNHANNSSWLEIDEGFNQLYILV